MVIRTVWKLYWVNRSSVITAAPKKSTCPDTIRTAQRLQSGKSPVRAGARPRAEGGRHHSTVSNSHPRRNRIPARAIPQGASFVHSSPGIVRIIRLRANPNGVQKAIEENPRIQALTILRLRAWNTNSSISCRCAASPFIMISSITPSPPRFRSTPNRCPPAPREA